MSEYRKARRNIEVSPGESVRIIRELQGMSQNELSKVSFEIRGQNAGIRAPNESFERRLGCSSAEVGLRCFLP